MDMPQRPLMQHFSRNLGTILAGGDVHAVEYAIGFRRDLDAGIGKFERHDDLSGGGNAADGTVRRSEERAE